MDYVSGSAFKMDECFIKIETEEVDYKEILPIWMCTQVLLITVLRNLSELAFQCLPQFPIPTLDAPFTLKTKSTTLDAPFTLKTKSTISRRIYTLKLKIINIFLMNKNVQLKVCRYI